jgi:hypothetical protein
MKRRSLIDMIERDLQRDLGDAPAVSVQDSIDLQDLGWMPETTEPVVRPEPRSRTGSS